MSTLPPRSQNGAVSFHPLPPPWDDDVVRLLDRIARAIHRLVQRRLALHGDDAPPDLLTSEQAEAVASLPFAGRAAFPRPGRRSAFLDGYSLHADRLVNAEDREGLERLCRYGARSPIANSRLTRNPAGQVVMALKRPLRDGRTELAFTPVEFLRRLATLIPPPRLRNSDDPDHRSRPMAITETGHSRSPKPVMAIA